MNTLLVVVGGDRFLYLHDLSYHAIKSSVVVKVSCDLKKCVAKISTCTFVIIFVYDVKK